MPLNIAPLLPTNSHFIPLADKIRLYIGNCQGKNQCEIKKIAQAASGSEAGG
jgi:hypothetical protein